MKRALYTIIPLFILGLCTMSYGQTIGIGTDFPTATLDVVTVADMPATRLTRSLTPAAATTPTLELNDDSDYGVIDLYYTNALSAGPAMYLQHDGIGNGLILNMFNGGSAAYAAVIINYSNSQGGMIIDNTFTSAAGVDLLMENGSAVQAIHFTESPNSFYTDLSLFPGLAAPTDNVGYIANLDGSDGMGFYFYNNDNFGGGDGYGFFGFAETLTPPSMGTVYGTLFGGEQNGVGHGILVNHDGTSGRNAEFNIRERNNTDEALIAIHSGEGSALVAQNQKDNMTNRINVGDFRYTGTDPANNHIAVFGQSLPDPSGGEGVVGEGNLFGVRSNGDLQVNGNSNVTGTKSFYIDHPLDPKNKILRHYSMESDQVLNVYQGTIVLDRRGRATVLLPEYFESININYSYQLTSIGTPRQPYVAQKIVEGKFVIAGQPNAEVSWMVIANRNDAYIRSNPGALQTEIAKRPENVGKFLDPESHGYPKTMGIYYMPPKVVESYDFEALPEPDFADKQQILEEKGMKDKITTIRETNAESRQRMPIPSMEIQSIRTWDELH